MYVSRKVSVSGERRDWGNAWVIISTSIPVFAVAFSRSANALPAEEAGLKFNKATVSEFLANSHKEVMYKQGYCWGNHG